MGGEREHEGRVGGVVEEGQRVGVHDGGRDGREMVAEEGARGGAAGAVDGGVVDTGEADRLGGGAQQAREGEVVRARGLGDEEVGAVALGGAVLVGRGGRSRVVCLWPLVSDLG